MGKVLDGKEESSWQAPFPTKFDNGYLSRTVNVISGVGMAPEYCRL